jgi:hypothetical protein
MIAELGLGEQSLIERIQGRLEAARVKKESREPVSLCF